MMKLKMMKSISKTVFALCIAVSIFVCNSAVASAKCPNGEGGLHYYGKREGVGGGYTDYLTHAHVTGHHANGEETYETCQVTMIYEYYVTKCWYCGDTEPGSRRLECEVRHSVN